MPPSSMSVGIFCAPTPPSASPKACRSIDLFVILDGSRTRNRKTCKKRPVVDDVECELYSGEICRRSRSDLPCCAMRTFRLPELPMASSRRGVGSASICVEIRHSSGEDACKEPKVPLEAYGFRIPPCASKLFLKNYF